MISQIVKRHLQVLRRQGLLRLKGSSGSRCLTKTWIPSGAVKLSCARSFSSGNWLSAKPSDGVSLEWSYVHCASDLPFCNLTLGGLLDKTAREFGGKEAVVSAHQGIRKTYQQMKDDSDKMAAGLLALGLKKGERIGIWGPNSYQWVLTMMAAAKAGLVLVNINPAYQPKELLYCLNKVGIRAMVSAESFKTQDYYAMMAEIIPELPSAEPGRIESEATPDLRHVIMISEKDFSGAYKFDDVYNAGGSADIEALVDLQKTIQADDAANIQFTSGTTGNPKGACLSHHNIVNNGLFSGYRLKYNEKHHRICLPVPLYHCFGEVVGIIASLNFAGTVVLPSYSFDPLAAMKTVQDEKCTSLYGTPTMFVDMLRVQEEKQFDLGSLHTGAMAGSPCPKDLCEQTIERLNMKDFEILYGLTETSPVSFQSFADDSDEIKTSTIGFPSYHVEAKVVNELGAVTPAGTPGELCTRGYSTMLGYWGDKEKTDEVVKPDRWFYTGDQAVIYPNGYAQIVGRIKDMVIRGGENIYPREIEEHLHTHPDIVEVQVIGVPDKRMGEELCAWIRTSTPMTEEDVKKFCHHQLAHFKIPRYIKFVEEFPTTVTGKVQKFKMREVSVKELGLEQ